MTTLTDPPDSRPALWNPNAAACWSLVFTPAFGAYLHARNAEALGRVDEAKANTVWFYASFAYLGFVLLGSFIPAIPEAVYRAAALGLLFGWYFAAGKKQIQLVQDTWKTSYRRKPWTKPLLVGLAGLIGFVAVCF